MADFGLPFIIVLCQVLSVCYHTFVTELKSKDYSPFAVFNGYYKLTPEKFTNVTNGIAYRRWLCQSNPELTKLLDEKIGPDYRKDASKLIDSINAEVFKNAQNAFYGA